MLRQKIYVNKKDEYLPFLYEEEGKLVLETHGEKQIFDNIEYVHIQPVTRIYMPSKAFILDRSVKGFMQTGRTQGIQMEFFIDIDIHTKENIYQYESHDLNTSLDFIKDISKLMKVEDPFDLMNKEDPFKYLEHNYRRLAKENHLDNPRMTKDEDLIQHAKH